MEEKKRELSRQEKLDLEAKINSDKEKEAVQRASESSMKFNQDAHLKRAVEEEKTSSFSMWGTLIMLAVVVVLVILFFVFKESLSSIQMFEPTEGLSK